MLRSLSADPEVFLKICDPARTSVFEALGLLHVLRQSDPQVDLRLVRRLMPEQGVDEPHLQDRVLVLLEATLEGPKLLPQLLQIYRVANERTRARLTTVIARCHRNREWLEDRMRDPDSRVRANAVEAFWGDDSPEAIQLFRRGVQDTAPRVVANSALGLYRAGSVESLAVLAHRLGESPAFPDRSSGAWAMGKTGDARFQKVLATLLKDPNPQVRRNAFRSVGELRKPDGKSGGRITCTLHFSQLKRSVGSEEALHLVMEIGLPDATPLQGVRPLDVHVLRNGEPVYHYSFQERTKAQRAGIYDLLIQTGDRSGAEPEVPGAMLKVEVRLCTTQFTGSHETYWFGT